MRRARCSNPDCGICERARREAEEPNGSEGFWLFVGFAIAMILTGVVGSGC